MRTIEIMLRVMLFLGIVALWLAKKIYFWLGIVPYSIGWFLVVSALALYLSGVVFLNQPINLFHAITFSAGLYAAIFILRKWSEIDKQNGGKEEQSDAMRIEALDFVTYPGLHTGRFFRGSGEYAAALSIYFVNGAALGGLFPPYPYGVLSDIGKVILVIGLWMLLLRFSGGQRGKLWKKLRSMATFWQAQPKQFLRRTADSGDIGNFIAAFLCSNVYNHLK